MTWAPRQGWNDLRAFLTVTIAAPLQSARMREPAVAAHPAQLPRQVLREVVGITSCRSVYFRRDPRVLPLASRTPSHAGRFSPTFWWAFVLMVPCGNSHLHCVMVRLVCTPLLRTRTRSRNFPALLVHLPTLALPQRECGHSITA